MKSRSVLQAVLLIVAAGVCAVISNAVAGSERRLAWLGGATASAAKRSNATAPAAAPSASAPAAAAGSQTTYPPHPDKPYVEISGEQSASLHAAGGILFLDARRTSVYREGHIPGARPFSVWEADIDDKVKAFFEEGHDPSTPIVVYCSGGDCEDSHMLAQKLYLVGFDDVLVDKDGFPDWQKRGLPVTKGASP